MPPAKSASESGKYGDADISPQIGGSAAERPSTAAASPHQASVCAAAALVYADALITPRLSSGVMTLNTLQLPVPSFHPHPLA